MSKKKLNKKGQQYKKQMQHTKNAAPRIDASKSIYEVDAKVQAYSAGECVEEADVALGVVTGDTEIVNPVTEEVVDVDPVPVEEIEEEEEYDTEDDIEDLDEDEMCDDEDDEYDDEVIIHTKESKHRKRAINAAMRTKVQQSAIILDAAKASPTMVNTESYGEKIISVIHKAKAILDKMDDELINRMRDKKSDNHINNDDVTFSGEFINWDGTCYTNSSVVMDVLEKQYNDFMSKKIATLNDTDVDNVFYCNDVKLMTCGALMCTGNGKIPVMGRVANITIYVPRAKLDEFIEKYTTPVCLCETCNKIPPHILALAAEGVAPIDGVRAYHIINMPEFLKLFANDRDRNIRLYDSDEGYSIMISNYDKIDNNNVRLTAPSYEASITFGMIKAMCY